MPPEPSPKRTVAFFDGQNLFHSSKEAFGFKFPNYDPLLLSQTLCSKKGWELEQVRFYTGVPDPTDDPFWNHFWSAKLAVMVTEWVPIDRATYDSCLDPMDYRSKGQKDPP